MRRISLALALFGAVAAAGCGGGAKPSSTAGTKGTAGVNFTVTVNNQGGGTVSDGAKTCAANTTCNWTYTTGTTVTLTATPGNLYFNGWFGGCSGTDVCTLTGQADKYVVAYFSATPQAHPNFNDGALHVKAVIDGALKCDQCHGPQLAGLGIAPACSSCHAWPKTGQLTTAGLPGHFDKAGALGGHSTGQCSRCHNSEGFRAFIGDATVTGGDGLPHLAEVATFTFSGTTKGMVCETCHNAVSEPIAAAGTLRTHQFPSGNVVTTDAKTAICSQCHDGGRPGYTVAALNTVLTNASNVSLAADAQLVASNATVRAHYLPAASTLFGADAANWYQYTGNIYTAKNQHGGLASCVDCHDAHNGDVVANVKPTTCGKCHFNEAGAPVANFLELEESRQFGFEGDIDGNGTQESLKVELNGLGAKLYAAIQAYATNVAGTSICTPNDNKFYVQANTTDACGTLGNATAYNKYTPRLLKAAYNYLIWQNDVGAWAHNPRYAIEVVYDSIADLNVALAPLGKNVPNGKRAFNGHFGAAEDPSPYAAMIYHGASNAVTGEVLPTMGFTSAACYQCHGGKGGYEAYVAGMPAALTNAVMTNKVNAMQCSTCHTYGADMKGIRNDVATVYFPPQKGTAAATPAQKIVSFSSTALPPSFAVCGTCHSGRENGASIDIKIGTKLDTDFSLSFTNPHYLGAAGMMLGSSAGMMYQYTGKSYTTTPAFWSLGANGPHGSPHGAKCTGCHNPKGSAHTFEIDLNKTVVNGTFYGAQNTKACSECHTGQYSLSPKITEFEEAAAELLTAIQTYAAANAATTGVEGICYNGNANPYFFNVVSGACSSTSFAKFNSKLLKAAYNYQWTQKEPGAWAHNEFYVLQAIYDSIVDLGGTPSFTVTASSTDLTLNRP